MTLRDLYLYCANELFFGECGDFEALCIFEDLLNCSKKDILLSKCSADEHQISIVNDVIERRKKGEPLQYILGKWDFYDMSFAVGEGVLIPRPETEMLVDFALEKLKETENPVIYDLCAGSGCIGLTLAAHLPCSTVYLVEKEKKAFKYLENNKIKYNLNNANLINGDIFLYDTASLPMADIIISNPPYIKSCEISGLQAEVQSEPITALDGGDDGLIFYRCIAERWCCNVKKDGYIALEHDKNQSDDIINIFCGKYSKKNVIFDFNNIDRIVTFRI